MSGQYRPVLGWMVAERLREISERLSADAKVAADSRGKQADELARSALIEGFQAAKFALLGFFLDYPEHFDRAVAYGEAADEHTKAAFEALLTEFFLAQTSEGLERVSGDPLLNGGQPASDSGSGVLSPNRHSGE